MKKLKLSLIVFFVAIVVINIATSSKSRIKPAAHNKNNIDAALKSIKIQQIDTGRVLLFVPTIKTNKVSWKDASISNWLSNYCADKCNDSISSGYKFSGQIKNTDKSWSLKVTIKTDKEYAQPVKFDPKNGKFDGKVYFDKFNRTETLINIMVRDSNNLVIKNFSITLTE
jgi:hypothetical protein